MTGSTRQHPLGFSYFIGSTIRHESPWVDQRDCYKLDGFVWSAGYKGFSFSLYSLSSTVWFGFGFLFTVSIRPYFALHFIDFFIEFAVAHFQLKKCLLRPKRSTLMPYYLTWYVQALIFPDDSIAAVEAAWGKVAKDIGQDPDYVIAATHGKRAVDNLSQFKPQLLLHEIEEEVERFENTILYYADAYHMHRDGSQSPDASGSSYSALSSPGKDMENHHPMYPIPESYAGSSDTTPDLTPGPTAPPSRRSSITHRSMSMTSGRRPSFGSRLLNMLGIAAHLRIQEAQTELEEVVEDCLIQQMDVDHSKAEEEKARRDIKDAWQVEAASTDRSVRILPGVRKMIDSLPEGRYAVATSGAKTYAYGCMKRVGIVPPPVTITADDKRLKAGKPAPDPFLLAAECLGYDAKRCVVFEDSPSGIRAGVASGATVIAVCTSHEREKIEGCGAHYIVENMEKVHCDVAQDGQLKFTVEA